MLIFKAARKSNHSDDPAEILRPEHCNCGLKHRERKPRKYTKKNTEYWENSIKTKCKQAYYADELAMTISWN